MGVHCGIVRGQFQGSHQMFLRSNQILLRKLIRSQIFEHWHKTRINLQRFSIFLVRFRELTLAGKRDAREIERLQVARFAFEDLLE